MDKFEYELKVEQIEKLIGREDYSTAKKIADTMEWKREKDPKLLARVAELYAQAGDIEKALKIYNFAYNASSRGLLILERMTELALIFGQLDLAEELCEEYRGAGAYDADYYLFKFQIAESRGEDMDKRISWLEKYCSKELDEEALYRLAWMYDRAGRIDDCVRICDYLIDFFCFGESVERAIVLKQNHAPLTKYQERRVTNAAEYEQNYQQYLDDLEEEDRRTHREKQQEQRIREDALMEKQENALGKQVSEIVKQSELEKQEVHLDALVADEELMARLSFPTAASEVTEEQPRTPAEYPAGSETDGEPELAEAQEASGDINEADEAENGEEGAAAGEAEVMPDAENAGEPEAAETEDAAEEFAAEAISEAESEKKEDTGAEPAETAVEERVSEETENDDQESAPEEAEVIIDEPVQETAEEPAFELPENIIEKPVLREIEDVVGELEAGEVSEAAGEPALEKIEEVIGALETEGVSEAAGESALEKIEEVIGALEAEDTGEAAQEPECREAEEVIKALELKETEDAAQITQVSSAGDAALEQILLQNIEESLQEELPVMDEISAVDDPALTESSILEVLLEEIEAADVSAEAETETLLPETEEDVSEGAEAAKSTEHTDEVPEAAEEAVKEQEPPAQSTYEEEAGPELEPRSRRKLLKRTSELSALDLVVPEGSFKVACSDTELGVKYALELVRMVPETERCERVAKISARQVNKAKFSGIEQQLDRDILLITNAGQLTNGALESIYTWMKKSMDNRVIFVDDQEQLESLGKRKPKLMKRFADAYIYEKKDTKEWLELVDCYVDENDCVLDDDAYQLFEEYLRDKEEKGDVVLGVKLKDAVQDALHQATKFSFSNMLSSILDTKYDEDGLLILKDRHFR